MSDTFAQFEKRLQSLERKHRELAEGYVAKINPDGLITIEPKQQKSGLLLKLFATAFLGVVVFKIAVLNIVGGAVYDERISALADGTMFERAVAWMMQADPLTERLSTLLSTVIG